MHVVKVNINVMTEFKHQSAFDDCGECNSYYQHPNVDIFIVCDNYELMHIKAYEPMHIKA